MLTFFEDLSFLSPGSHLTNSPADGESLDLYLKSIQENFVYK